ncbi:MAG: ABC transporter permease [Candidatus Carbobacillus altaicus]|uniref:Oligopeptide transport system permease protein OppB n=1 Tax=Candidatus Carbonibacillus altaicus TaxID=2163959 RepID=A0A2R6Y5J8_9BACL|nr:ABC transporter permease [Candidatus Carbobacillus altaicus]PTQ57950.1 MAG: Oligopeptide transport system permease protein OppB [Candidatus Carbobacillus altaicus]
MVKYILKRTLWMIVTLWVIITLTFILMHSIPGDPFSQEGKKYPEQILKNLRAKYHLDQPLYVQYLLYLKNILVLDFGPSIKSDVRTVNDVIRDGFPVSLQLGLFAVGFALLFGIIFGIIAALNRGRPLDYISVAIAVLGISIPSFILAPLLQKVFALDWKILPPAQWGSFKHMILPAFALSLGPLAVITRLMRSSMLDVLGQEYIKTAEAKGLGTFAIMVKHALRNAILPIITYLGPLLASVLTGTFVIEKIFAIPGLGKYFVDSIVNRDYPMIMGTTIFYSIILVVLMLAVDIAYTLIDPRIRLTAKED